MIDYKAIVFDFDGTLVDTFEIKTKAFGEMYQKYGDKILISNEGYTVVTKRN